MNKTKHTEELQPVQPVELSASPTPGYREISGVVLRAVSTEQSALESHQEARTDQLTGVGNLRAYNEAADDVIKETRAKGGDLAMLFIDIDGLKRVNDTAWGQDNTPNSGDSLAGWTAGNKLLTTVAQNVRKGDQIFRVGGDEFVMLMPNFGDERKQSSDQQPQQSMEDKAQAAASRLGNMLNDLIAENELWSSVHAGVSVGAALMQEGDTPESLSQRAAEDMGLKKKSRRRELEEQGIKFADDRVIEQFPPHNDAE